MAVLVSGCSSSTHDEADPARQRASTKDAPWADALRDPGVETVLRALAQPHAAVRDAIGPHRLRYTAELSLVDPASGDDEALPELDAPAVLDQEVHDELELVWAPSSPATPRLRLRQSNDHERGREVILVDGRLHTRQRHRPWVHYPVETDLHERWLDDAQRAVHDVVELAAPRLRIDAQTTDRPGFDGAAVALKLGLAEATNATLQRSGSVSRWRGQAEVQQVSGEIVLDATTGAWLSANVDVQYALEAADGRTLRGAVHLEGTVEPLPEGGVDIRAPADSEPLAERTRLQAERQELLDGLAAPR